MTNKELLCPCGSRDYTSLFTGTCSTPRVNHPFNFQILKCNKCGLARTYPMPYGGNISTYESPEWALGAIENETVRNRYIFGSISSEILKEIEREKEGGRLLDVGCGVGTLLNLARNNGWDTYGVELSKTYCDYTKSIGLKVSNSDLTDAGFIEGFFDAISMVHVLEHIPELFETLNEAWRILKHDGILVVDTPDIGTLTARFQKGHYVSLDPDCHIWQFTPETLSNVLLRAGFTPIRVVQHSRSWRYWKILFILDNPESGISRVRGSFHIPLQAYGFFHRYSHEVLGKTVVGIIKAAFRPLFQAGICGDSVCVIAKKGDDLGRRVK